MNSGDIALHILTMPIEEVREKQRLIDSLRVTQHRAAANGGDPSAPTQSHASANPRTEVDAARTCLEDTEKTDIRRWVLSLKEGSRFTTTFAAERLRLARPLWSAIGRVLGRMVIEGHLAHDGTKQGLAIYARRNPSNVLGKNT